MTMANLEMKQLILGVLPHRDIGRRKGRILRRCVLKAETPSLHTASRPFGSEGGLRRYVDVTAEANPYSYRTPEITSGAYGLFQ